MTTPTQTTFGDCLRDWRGRRGMSQLQLALAANVSQRHVSFLESGRAQPSRPMVLGLADAMSVPLAERNNMLNAAGFAPQYRQSSLDDTALQDVRAALDLMLERHMPYPAVLIDRYWNLLDSNASCEMIFGLSAGPAPINILKMISDHPELTERFANWPEVAHHLLMRLQTELNASGGDPKLAELIEGLKEAPVFQAANHGICASHPFIPTRIRFGDKVLSLVSAIAHFGTATDITVSDLRIEFSLPADAETDLAIRQLIGNL
jgi:transcriptional regulator with XRE-family HTH domain